MMDTRFVGDDDLALFFLIHKAIRLEARALAHVLAAAAESSPERLAVLAQRFAVLRTAIHKHHEGEDAYLYPLLLAKDATFARDARVLEGEHQLLGPLEENLARRLREAQRAKSASEIASMREALVDSAERFASAMFAHLDREEAAVVPRLRDLVTLRELKDLEAKMGKSTTLREISLVLPWILENADPRERALLDETLPWLAKLLYRLSWKQRYARLTVMPPSRQAAA